MSLKMTIRNLEDVPGTLRSFYEKQSDGTFLLTVDESDTRSRINEFRTNNIQFQKRIQELESAMKRRGTYPAEIAGLIIAGT